MAGRGPTPKHAAEVPQTVGEVTPPDFLQGEALAFWGRNSNVIRGTEDVDSFVLLCTLWCDCFALEGRQRIDAVRQFNSLARQFGMTPDSRRRIAASNADRHADKPEFTF